VGSSGNEIRRDEETSSHDGLLVETIDINESDALIWVNLKHGWANSDAFVIFVSILVHQKLLFRIINLPWFTFRVRVV